VAIPDVGAVFTPGLAAEADRDDGCTQFCLMFFAPAGERFGQTPSHTVRGPG
jgi:hypothetical protein